MDNANTFENFLANIAGFTTQNAVATIRAFTPNFNSLISVSETDMKQFVKDTHAANSGRADNDKVFLPAGAMLNLLAIHHELRDRIRCGVVPDNNTLQNIDIFVVQFLRGNRSDAIQRLEALKTLAKSLPDMNIPKLTNTNYDEFLTSFTTMCDRIVGSFGIPISYLLRTTQRGNYMTGAYTTREERLHNCLVLQGPLFQADSQLLYSLYVQHIGTSGTGSNVVNAHRLTQNGRECFMDINNHYRNQSFRDTLASKAQQSIERAHYDGDRRNFTLESFYNIMVNAFNDLESAGPQFALREDQKVNQFLNKVKNATAVNYIVIAKREWNNLLPPQTFDSFYNIFSSYMNQHRTLVDTPNQHRRINNTNTNRDGGRGGRDGRGRGRGRSGRFGGRDNGRGRGHFGRGRGRFGNRNFHDNHSYGSFRAEPKMYPPSVYRTLTYQQKQDIRQAKLSAGWIDANTPPHGHIIDNDTGLARPSDTLISNLATSVNNFNSQARMPPRPPSVNPPIPPNVETGRAGSHFGRSGNRQQPSDQSSVGMVSINGRDYNGRIYASSGNPLN